MMTPITTTIKALVFALWPAWAGAACQDITHDGRDYTLCEAVAGDDVRLFHSAPDGTLYGGFDAVNAVLAQNGARLAFAMNAGMYHADRRAVGLLVIDGQEQAAIVTRAGPGNFGMLPNGVLCIGDGFSIVDSRAYAADPPECRHATQSGPMLVIDGALHPRFLPDSDSRYVRNGVGVSADGRRAVFALSRDRVSFHEFARLFRDGLGLPRALYFDGNISRLHAPELGRSDAGFPMGPIIGMVVPAG